MTSSKTVSLLGKTLTQDEMCSYLYENRAEHLSAWENLGTWRVKYSPAAMFSLTGQGDTVELAEEELKANMIFRMKGIQNLLGFVTSPTMEELKNLPKNEELFYCPLDFTENEEDGGDYEENPLRFSVTPLLGHEALEDFTSGQIFDLAKIAQSKYSSIQEKERLLAGTYGPSFRLATVMIEGHSAEKAGTSLDWARNVLEEWANDSGVHVHVTHCCTHLCKYGSPDCPVVLLLLQGSNHGSDPCICDY